MSVHLTELFYTPSQAPGIITALLILGGAANINKLLPDTNRDSILTTCFRAYNDDQLLDLLGPIRMLIEMKQKPAETMGRNYHQQHIGNNSRW